jgi:hypothetical protein
LKAVDENSETNGELARHYNRGHRPPPTDNRSSERQSKQQDKPRGCEEPIIRFSLLEDWFSKGKVAKNHMAYAATVQRST